MRYLGGGIGHKVSHQASPAVPSGELVNDNADREESNNDQEEIEDHPQHDGLGGEEEELEVPFNRMIIQQTRAYTLHGYDMTNFPEGQYRTSIATYAYSIHKTLIEKKRTTDWVVKDGKPIKKAIAAVYGPAVKIKNILFGSGTAKNK